MTSSRPPTIKDVAALAGVSWKTVTNVVHERTNVAPDTRARVLAAIAQLDYRTALPARQLRQGRTHTLTLVVPDVRNPYFSMLIEAVFAAAQVRGYAVFVETAGRAPRDEERAASSLLRFAFDGVIFSPTYTSPTELLRLAARLPVVLLGENTAGAGLDTVAIDNVAAAREITEHLVTTGRRRIAFVGHRPDGAPEPGGVRVQGFTEALAAAGLAPAALVEALVYDEAGGAAGVARLLADAPDVDGIVCANDLLATGVLHGLRAAGRTVPGDVAVTGWDDIPVAAYLDPGITTVAPDVPALAGAAVDRVVARVDGADGPWEQVVVPHRIVVRGSTTPGVSS
ncbi:LacI family DNA-binding transcriptional regulator [Pseudonocardia sp. CA-107938]|uniref:LacI family DNA-binding transcriptional regulator n=1 Tax=Pseudonocardia sp. CA-107938 TaxID=3240021 RepID=UPI003D93FF43